MKSWISASSSSSEPYSSGSDGRSTTSFLIRLLWGEYGTHRRKGSASNAGSIVHRSLRQSAKAVRFSSGRQTISRIAPSSKTADTVGTGRCFFALRAVLLRLGFMFEAHLIQGVESLAEAELLDLPEKRDDVAVLEAAEAVEGAGLGIGGERRVAVVVEGTAA